MYVVHACGVVQALDTSALGKTGEIGGQHILLYYLIHICMATACRIILHYIGEHPCGPEDPTSGAVDPVTSRGDVRYGGQCHLYKSTWIPIP